jgi:hypothetical protein
MPQLSLVALPDWLTQEGYLTLATWGLVAATILLFLITLFLYLPPQQNLWADSGSGSLPSV